MLKNIFSLPRLSVPLAPASLLAASTPAVSADAPAGYPARPVSIVVPFAPGGATDIIGRLLADELKKRWGKPIVVENRAGAGGGIGTEYVAKAKADGYTLLLGTQTALSVNPILPRSSGKTTYRPIRNLQVKSSRFRRLRPPHFDGEAEALQEMPPNILTTGEMR